MRTHLIAPALALVSIVAFGSVPALPASSPSGTNRDGILLRLADDVGHTATIVVAAGSTATVSRTGHPSMRLRPVLLQDGRLRLDVSGGDAEAVAAGSGTWSAIGTLTEGETAAVTVAGYLLDVQWTGLTAMPDSTFATASGDPVKECCIVCDGFRTCACRVEAACGYCCAPGCGGCGATFTK